MKIIKVILLLTFISSCYNADALRERAKHESQAGERINRSEQNTEHLFKDLED